MIVYYYNKPNATLPNNINAMTPPNTAKFLVLTYKNAAAKISNTITTNQAVEPTPKVSLMSCFAPAAKSFAIEIVGNAEIAVAVKAVFAFDNAF